MINITPDILGHLFYFWIITGTILVTKKKKVGWIFRVAGDIGWATVGVMTGMTSIWFWSTMFAINDARGYWLWRKNEDTKRESQGQKSTEPSGESSNGSI